MTEPEETLSTTVTYDDIQVPGETHGDLGWRKEFVSQHSGQLVSEDSLGLRVGVRQPGLQSETLLGTKKTKGEKGRKLGMVVYICIRALEMLRQEDRCILRSALATH